MHRPGRLLREFLQAHPREHHLRHEIAEIYARDLQNPRAAALEYEAALHPDAPRLPTETTAEFLRHLCRLQAGPLQDPAAAVETYRRLKERHPRTEAARQARLLLEKRATGGAAIKPD